MATAKEITQLEQRIARLERSQAMQKIKKRKLETRKKIQLGGLVTKAGMNTYPKDVILGALIDSKQQIESNNDEKRFFELKGRAAFLDKESSP